MKSGKKLIVEILDEISSISFFSDSPSFFSSILLSMEASDRVILPTYINNIPNLITVGNLIFK